MLRLVSILASLLLTVGCGCGEPDPVAPTAGDATASVEEPPAAEPALTADQIVELSAQLQGEWRLLLSEEEHQQRQEALAQLTRLGDDPHAREMRAALSESINDGMTVGESTIDLRLMRRKVALTWTLMQEDPAVFAIETLDAEGLRQVFEVTFDGADKVTLSAKDGANVSRFERLIGPRAAAGPEQ